MECWFVCSFSSNRLHRAPELESLIQKAHTVPGVLAPHIAYFMLFSSNITRFLLEKTAHLTQSTTINRKYVRLGKRNSSEQVQKKFTSHHDFINLYQTDSHTFGPILACLLLCVSSDRMSATQSNETILVFSLLFQCKSHETCQG